MASSIQFDEKARTFYLNGRNYTYAFAINQEGWLENLHYGGKIPQDTLKYIRLSDLGLFPHNAKPTSVVSARTKPEDAKEEVDDSPTAAEGTAVEVPVIGKNGIPLEFSEAGGADFRTPTCHVHSLSQGIVSAGFRYKCHEITAGKPPMSTRLPAARGSDGNSETLTVTLRDAVLGMEADLVYTVYPDSDVLARRIVYRNASDSALELRSAASATFDLPAASRELLSLNGGWAAERHPVCRRLAQGRHVLESRRGISSHQSNPFIAISTDGMNEQHGEVFGFMLVYSGNFKFEVEVDEAGCCRVNGGVHNHMFTWDLAPKEAFEAPEVLSVYSNAGVGSMSRQLHAFIRNHIVPERWRNLVCPVLLNTWEAMYFKVSHERVVTLAKAAAAAGIEMLVVDDGWFLGRNNDTTSLGDWEEDTTKLTKGLPALVEEVRSQGLRFGIWVEPEMVNRESNLYKAHPDWAMSTPGRCLSEGRQQLVLDFTRVEVQDHIIAALKKLLSGSAIDYVKWDMNRSLTEVWSGQMGAASFRVYHEWMLGVYRVLQEVTEAFPSVLFEMCSSGGGRFDAGMLTISPQIWTSDNTDAMCRLPIQYGSSIAYPLSCLGAHISASPNHQMHRLATLKTRFLTSVFGTFGFELDATKFSEAEVAEVKGYIKLRNALAPLIVAGDFYRLWGPLAQFTAVGGSPADSDAYAWMVVGSADSLSQASSGMNPPPAAAKEETKESGVPALKGGGQVALAAAYCARKHIARKLPRLRLQGLSPSSIYLVQEVCPGVFRRNPSNGKLEHFPDDPAYVLPSKQGGGAVLELSGASLMNVGLPVRFEFDGDSIAYLVEEKRRE